MGKVKLILRQELGKVNTKMRSNTLVLALFLILLGMLALSIALNFSLFTFSKKYYLQLNGTRLDPLGLDHFSHYSNQAEQQNSDTVNVVFFGDSRAAEWPFPTVDGFEFTNRGIGAQTSNQIILRYDDHVKWIKPDILVVQVCINDLKTIPLFPERKETIIADCKDNIQQIVQKAIEQDAIVILSTVFPVGQVPIERKLFWSDEIPSAVEEVNSFIKSLAGEEVVVFDAFSILADEGGQLAERYSRDELHLNSTGYETLNREFVPLIKSLHE